jgi:hypothetical protein
MGIPVEQDSPAPLDWLKSETYHWMSALPKLAWGWELMRRNLDYQRLYAQLGSTPPALSLRDLWPIVQLEDPALDARFAAVFWRGDMCAEVLPVAVSTQFQRYKVPRLSLQELHCRVTVLPGDHAGHCHVLFSQQGRSLQLSVCGTLPLSEGSLLTPVPSDPAVQAVRQMGMRRLADLLDCGCLRRSLYPAEPRGARLARVVQVLDGDRDGASQREIGIALFGKKRVEDDWHHPHNYLRDHVRRALAHGRDLMVNFSRLVRS